MTDKIIPYGKARAIQLLVANELGIISEYVAFAELYMEGKLFETQFARMEIAAWKAVMEINEKGLTAEATLLAENYYKKYKL